MSESMKGRIPANKGKKFSEETRKKMSKTKKKKGSGKGEKNSMYGRSVYSVWLLKYGKEEADKRLKEMCEKKKHKYNKN